MGTGTEIFLPSLLLGGIVGRAAQVLSAEPFRGLALVCAQKSQSMISHLTALLYVVRQVIILAGVGWGAVNTRVTTLLGDPVPNQAQWAQRMEVMQLEAAALSQRLEILNAELAAAAQLLLNKSADVA